MFDSFAVVCVRPLGLDLEDLLWVLKLLIILSGSQRCFLFDYTFVVCLFLTEVNIYTALK